MINNTPHYPITREQLTFWLRNDARTTHHTTDFQDNLSPLNKSESKLTTAAVLIPIINHQNDQRILFTQRTDHLTHHPGQISFPGGRVEPSDHDSIHTALRETWEETGLATNHVAVLGILPHYITGTGYHITPVVGWVDSPVIYQPDPAEVAECFEVPLHFLINPDNHRYETAMYMGRLRSYYAIPYENRYIWGATAGILVTLSKLIAQATKEGQESR